MFEIYVNPQLEIGKVFKRTIDSALDTLVSPPAQATTGLFAATLTWDGLGDADLHVTEPDGNEVWFLDKMGHVGYLDVDNTYGYGPEHYYASCDVQKMQSGLYSIDVANYSKAMGRIATVQITSFYDGVLGTRSVLLGPSTGITPSATLFKVAVTKDTEGQYAVSVAN